MRLHLAVPVDAAAFVVDAERASNAYDLEAVTAVYAGGARFDVIFDGAREVHTGAAAIHLAWAGYLRGMCAQRMSLRKELLSASGDCLTNAWEGTLGGAHAAAGLEAWRFDTEGCVVEHRMWSHLDVRHAAAPRARARLALAYPRMALDLWRAQRQVRLSA